MINGEKVKNERIKRGLSQEELGKILGVTKVSVCGYEKGTRTPTLETFIHLLDVLELSPDELLGRTVHAVAENTPYEVPITEQELAIIQAMRQSKEFRLRLTEELSQIK